MSETTKANFRRQREGFFEKYVRGRVIDIGCGEDPLTDTAERFDRVLGSGDAHFLHRAPGGYDCVYSSHLLEHLDNPEEALRNWWGLVKEEGYLALYVPHRDLYEKRRVLPSRWNGEHKFFLLPERDEAPCTFSLWGMLHRTCPGGVVHYVRVCQEGWTIPEEENHSNGEYSIEAVVQKGGMVVDTVAVGSMSGLPRDLQNLVASGAQ